MSKEYTWSDNQTDEIWYNDRFDSVEDCIKDAIKQGRGLGEQIAIGICEDYVPHVSVSTLLDQASEDAYEECGEVAEGWPGFGKNGYRDVEKLQEKINKVFNEWLKETDQVPTFYHICPLADLVTIAEES